MISVTCMACGRRTRPGVKSTTCRYCGQSTDPAKCSYHKQGLRSPGFCFPGVNGNLVVYGEQEPLPLAMATTLLLGAVINLREEDV